MNPPRPYGRGTSLLSPLFDTAQCDASPRCLDVLLADGAEERRSALEMGRHMRQEFTEKRVHKSPDNLIHSNAYETQTPAPDAQWRLSASISIPNQH